MQNAIELTRLLVSMESSNPGVYEYSLADYLEAQLSAVLPAFGRVIRMEYEDKESTQKEESAKDKERAKDNECTKETDRTRDEANSKEGGCRKRPIIMAELPGTDSTKELVFLCHMDTVPIGENWTRAPFGEMELNGKKGVENVYAGMGRISESTEESTENGRIYGRGSCDMKSGLACAFMAFKEACRLATEQGEFRHTLKLILTSDEEGEMQGVEHAVNAGWVQSTSYVMDCEPTKQEVQTAHKGRFWYAWTCYGKAAHASKPKEGANAILGMGYAMVMANSLIKELNADDFCGESSLTFGKIEGGTQKYQVPEMCRVSVDMRLVPPYDVNTGERILKKAAEYAMEMVDGVHFEERVTGNRPAVAHQPQSKLLELLCNTIEDVTKERPNVTVFPGYTDTAVVASMLSCKETLSYGPGNLAQAHQADEFVEISDIVRCERVYKELVKRFVWGDDTGD